MNSFHLVIVTPDGQKFDGQAERIRVRSTVGDVAILANHVNYVTAIGMGPARVLMNDKTRVAACIGGMLSVTNGEVRVIATTFEWADEIDKPRAEAALARAEKNLTKDNLQPDEKKVYEAAKRRAQVRLSLAE